MEPISAVPKTQIPLSIVANEIGIATSPETAVMLQGERAVGPYVEPKGVKILPLAILLISVWYFFLK